MGGGEGGGARADETPLTSFRACPLARGARAVRRRNEVAGGATTPLPQEGLQQNVPLHCDRRGRADWLCAGRMEGRGGRALEGGWGSRWWYHCHRAARREGAAERGRGSVRQASSCGLSPGPAKASLGLVPACLCPVSPLTLAWRRQHGREEGRVKGWSSSPRGRNPFHGGLAGPTGR